MVGPNRQVARYEEKLSALIQPMSFPTGWTWRRFRPLPVKQAKERLDFNDKKHVLFIGDPARSEKNFTLAREAVDLLGDISVELHTIFDKPQGMLPDYLNATDLLMLTSIYEGSPNVIKEAMACNCPIVATDVGDIKWIIGNTDGCFLSSFTPKDMALKIQKALTWGKRTNGRQRLIELELNCEKIAKRIIVIYQSIIKSKGPN